MHPNISTDAFQKLDFKPFESANAFFELVTEKKGQEIADAVRLELEAELKAKRLPDPFEVLKNITHPVRNELLKSNNLPPRRWMDW